MNQENPAEFARTDQDKHWHPWSSQEVATQNSKLILTDGFGYRVIDSDGRSYIDGRASSLNSCLGYRDPDLLVTAMEQLERMPHCDLTVSAHLPAIELADQLVKLMPMDDYRAFFVNSGSEAIECAVQMVHQYWSNLGETRQRIVTFERGYHGSTYLAKQLSGLPILESSLPSPFEIRKIRLPVSDAQLRFIEPEMLIASFLEVVDSTCAAVIVEPLLNVGGGVMMPKGFLKQLELLCKKSGALLVVDEVFCGFGRTGAWFGFDHESVVPDIVALSKGMTSGYFPLGAVTSRTAVYEAIRHEPVIGGLKYGHTTGGHAAACATSVKSIQKILASNLLNHVQEMGERSIGRLARLQSPLVSDIRGLGLVIVIEVISDDVATIIVKEAQAHGLLLRQQASAIMFVPPLIIDDLGIDEAMEILENAIAKVEAITSPTEAIS